MILADKIINERKKNGWSQEELAERLSVSRQSVSKWEGAQSVPDLQKVIQMAELFGVTTDYLLKDEIEPAEHTDIVLREDAETVPPVRKVSMEEANEFIRARKKLMPAIAMGVSMCVFSPVVLIFLAGLADAGTFGISENLAVGIGIITLLLLIAGAVAVFIFSGMSLKPFDYLENEEFETEYGVAGMAREKQQKEQPKSTLMLVVGVFLCILCPLPLIIAALAEAEEYIVVSMVCVLLTMVAIAVNLFINSCTVTEACKMLLCEDEYSSRKKRNRRRLSPLAGAFWLLATAIYLGISFYTEAWHRTWIIWPVAGVLFAVVECIAAMILKDED